MMIRVRCHGCGWTTVRKDIAPVISALPPMNCELCKVVLISDDGGTIKVHAATVDGKKS